MEAENALDQSPGRERQKREDVHEESRYLMEKLKAFRENVLVFIDMWKDLEFEEKQKKGVPANLYDSMDTFVSEYFFKMRKLFSVVKYEDLLNEVALFQEIVGFCHDEMYAYMKTHNDKYRGEWGLCCSKLKKIDNLTEKIKTDTADWKLSTHELLGTLTDFVIIEDKLGDSGELSYESVRKRMDDLMDVDIDLSKICNGLDRIQSHSEAILNRMKRFMTLRNREVSENETRSGSNVTENRNLIETSNLNYKKVSRKTVDEDSELALKFNFRRGRESENNQNSESGSRRQFRRKEVNDISYTNTSLPETENMDLRHQDVQGKKETQGLVNNVIEETASKLFKKRKSKVKALVGAFETVISLHESKPFTTTTTTAY